MSAEQTEWPEEGDLVVATVRRIVGHGAYVTLDEYDDREGLLHISEISSRWVRNIRNHVRERQKTVLQVNRVDPSRKQIDLSLRRVTQDDRRKKLEDWKKNRKAETLIRNAAVTLKMSEEAVLTEVGAKLIDHYGSLYNGLEEAAKRGVDALTEADVPAKIAKTLAGVAEEKIIVKGVTIHGILEISSMESRGVEDIKETLIASGKVAADHDAKTTLYSLGAPKYRLEITAEDYRKAEAALDSVVKYATDAWSGHDGSISFTRE